MRGLAFVLALSACGSESRPRMLGADDGHVHASATFQPAKARVHVRRLGSFTQLPRYGVEAPDLAVTSDRDWMQFVDQGVNIFARGVPDGTGDMYLPIFEPTTWGLPNHDRGTVVVQLVDADGNPIVGGYADDPASGSGPFYDDGENLIEHTSTGYHGTIVISDVPPSGDTSLNVHVGADVFVVQVPIVGGTVTYVQTKVP